MILNNYFSKNDLLYEIFFLIEYFLRFENSKWLQCSNGDDFQTIIIHLNSIHTEISNMSIQQLENQLERIKQLYINETGKTVIDKTYSE